MSVCKKFERRSAVRLLRHANSSTALTSSSSQHSCFMRIQLLKKRLTRMTEDASETGDAHVADASRRPNTATAPPAAPAPPRTHKQQREHSGDAGPARTVACNCGAESRTVQLWPSWPTTREGGAVCTLRGSVSVVRTPRHATPPNRAAADSSQRIGPRPVRRSVADSLGFRLINYGPELSLDVWPPDRCVLLLRLWGVATSDAWVVIMHCACVLVCMYLSLSRSSPHMRVLARARRQRIMGRSHAVCVQSDPCKDDFALVVFQACTVVFNL